MKLQIRRKTDGEVFEVWKYEKGINIEYVRCIGWDGVQIIGKDCEWAGQPPDTEHFVEWVKENYGIEIPDRILRDYLKYGINE